MSRARILSHLGEKFGPPKGLILFALARVIAGCGPQAAPPKVPPVSPEIAALQRAFAELGVAATEPPLAASLHEGERIGGFATVEPGRCLLAVGRGGAEDIDVAMFDDDGAVLAFDEEPDAAPAALYCAPIRAAARGGDRTNSGERVYVALTVSGNRGRAPALVALGLTTVPASDAAALRTRLEKPARGPQPSRVEARIDRLLVARERELGVRLRELRRMEVPLDPALPSVFGVPIEAGQCVDVALLGDDFGAIDGEFRDGDDRLLTRFDEREKRRTALVCAGKTPRTTTVTLRPHAGAGNVIVLVSASPRSSFEKLPTSGSYAFSDPLRGAPTNAGKLLRTQALSAGERLLQQGFSSGCRQVFAAAEDEGALRLAARTDGSATTPIDETDGEGSLTLAFCGAGRVVIDAPIGHAKVSIHEFALTPPASLQTLPQPVSARLLRRLGDAARAPESAWTISSIAGSANGALEIPLPLLAHQCVDLAATRSDDARTGIALEVHGGGRFDRNSGARSAYVRVCRETDEDAPLVVELRADGPVQWARVVSQR